MSTQAHCEPVILLGASRRERLVQSLKQVIAEWRQQWSGGTPAGFEVDVADALSRRPTLHAGRALTFSAAAGDERLLVITVPAESQHELLGLPAPRTVVDGGGETAAAVVSEALQALCSRLTRAKAASAVDITSLSADKLPQVWGQYGLTVTIKTASERVLLRARMFPELLQALLPPQAGKPAEALVSRRSAIGAEPVAVNAWLGEVEVTLDELASLQVGDVLLLAADVNGAGHLSLPDGRELAQIRLGSAAGRRAVSVIGKTAGMPSRSV